ncbi:hypothetical protein P167DRAFT_208775 [Morchella conica CCBAS932]|uniref:Uncharacterized protein n=1 Tax=Morchella conica CCBAS932 TaxID=1392247 RepID=A0A3N4KLZ3_9PEZI|nr:hypothetical protein P167DRAFT_208775 [Morchella conica CCBAS932]
MDEQKPLRQGKFSNEAPKPERKASRRRKRRSLWESAQNARALDPTWGSHQGERYTFGTKKRKGQKSSEEAKAPLESAGVELGLPKDVSARLEDVPEPLPVSSGMSIVRTTKTAGRCFRIQNVPPAWSKDILLGLLQGANDSLQSLDESGLSFFPACSGPTQTALLCPEETPAILQWPEDQDSMRLQVSNDSERKKSLPRNRLEFL